MNAPLKCAVCHFELTTADAEDAVRTDVGPCHRECFHGPVPPQDNPDDVLGDAGLFEENGAPEISTWTDEKIEAEEDARREHNDVPLPDRGDGFHNAMASALTDDGEATDCFECHAEPAINGGLGFLCRGRSML